VLPATADAVILAVRYKKLPIVQLLLEADLDRWETTEGRQVLNVCLQLAVDESFVEGVTLLKMYTDGSTPKKSAAALRKLLVDAWWVEQNLASCATTANLILIASTPTLKKSKICSRKEHGLMIIQTLDTGIDTQIRWYVT
jgi:hypothetical protein